MAMFIKLNGYVCKSKWLLKVNGYVCKIEWLCL